MGPCLINLVFADFDNIHPTIYFGLIQLRFPGYLQISELLPNPSHTVLRL